MRSDEIDQLFQPGTATALWVFSYHLYGIENHLMSLRRRSLGIQFSKPKSGVSLAWPKLLMASKPYRSQMLNCRKMQPRDQRSNLRARGELGCRWTSGGSYDGVVALVVVPACRNSVAFSCTRETPTSATTRSPFPPFLKWRMFSGLRSPCRQFTLWRAWRAPASPSICCKDQRKSSGLRS